MHKGGESNQTRKRLCCPDGGQTSPKCIQDAQLLAQLLAQILLGRVKSIRILAIPIGHSVTISPT